MNKFIFLLFAVALLATQPAAGWVVGQSYSSLRVAVAVDGVWVGFARSTSGGEPRRTVVVQSSSTGPAKKTLGSLTYAPIVLDMELPLSPVLTSWITDFCDNKNNGKTVLVTTMGFNGTNTTTLQAINTRLTEVRISALDTMSKEAVLATLVLSPESTTAGGSPPPVPLATTKQSASQNFRFTLAGLTTIKTTKIAAFSIKQGVTAAVDFPNLVVTLSGSVSDWNAWRDDFVVSGNSSDTAEKNGLIELLSTDLKTTLCAFQLNHVGLVRLTPAPIQTGENVVTVDAELYVESMSPVVAGTAAPRKGETTNKDESPVKRSPAKTPADPTKPTASNQASDPTATAGAGTPEQADPTKTISDPTLFPIDGTKSDPTKPLTNPTLASPSDKKYDFTLASDSTKKNDPTLATVENSRAQIGADPTKPDSALANDKKGDPTLNPVDPTQATPSADPTAKSDPTKADAVTQISPSVPKKSDQATRDIIDFPKPADAVRRSYNVYRSANSTQETASYASKSSLTDTTEFYASGLGAAGWLESNRMETDDATGNATQVVMHWAKKLRTASITLILQKEGGVVINITEATSTK